jgi:hypothetical protein
MKKLIVASAVAVSFAFSGVALASNCPVLIKQGQEAAAKMNPNDAKVKQAVAKLDEAQKLHDTGNHADSVKAAQEAKTLLGIQ